MPNEIVTAAIDQVASGRDLSVDQARDVLREIMEGSVAETQTAAFLIALRTKGETVDELAGLARTMRDLAVPVRASSEDLLDTAGTGGGAPTFNVSTTAALIATAAGARVAKHGNRSATSQSGSADLLEALGARIDLSPEAVARCIDEVGFGFMFAPAHHQATRYVVPVRKALGVRTVFNLLGPLTNPAGATRQLIGVSDPGYLELMAGALRKLGTTRAVVVSSEDGLDEVSISGETMLVEVTPEGIAHHAISPERVGLERATLGEVRGGPPQRNAEITRSIFSGAEQGPMRSLAAINAGAALLVAGRADSFEEGVRQAGEAIDSGAAQATLDEFVTRSNELAPQEATR
ncbi:MAG: anthranilate phosphoribosyltransferase [Solirubrobacterales bacterium]